METRVVHCRAERYDIFIGRPSIWGNPFIIGRDGSRSDVIRKFRHYVKQRPYLVELAKRELKGRVLGCFCKPLACHGDVLAEIANAA